MASSSSLSSTSFGASSWEHDNFDAFLAEGADELEYVRARTRMEALIASSK